MHLLLEEDGTTDATPRVDLNECEEFLYKISRKESTRKGAEIELIYTIDLNRAPVVLMMDGF